MKTIEELANEFIERTKLIYAYHDKKLREEGLNPSNTEEDVRSIMVEALETIQQQTREELITASGKKDNID